MARPRKWRKVCGLPECSRFGPLNVPANKGNFITMSIDEYETIRLIDLEGFTQEECAQQMHIARTTVQGIYDVARKILAEALVHGRELRVEGGDYKLCDGLETSCGRGGCRRHRFAEEVKSNRIDMKEKIQ